MVIGIVRGLMRLHANKIIHLDLKPKNILLDNQFNPVISDFGSIYLWKFNFLIIYIIYIIGLSKVEYSESKMTIA